MFLLNSRMSLFIEAFDSKLSKAPLLPKLRGHFAEFLNEGSFERLRIFSSSTCVGLRYERMPAYTKLFLGSRFGQFARSVDWAPQTFPS